MQQIFYLTKFPATFYHSMTQIHFYPIFDMAVHLAGFHKAVIQSIVRCFRSIPHFPIFKKMQIIRQHPEAQPFVLSELADIGMFRLDHSCGSGRFRVKSEANFCAACKLVRLNSLATRSITSPLAPQPKQKK